MPLTVDVRLTARDVRLWLAPDDHQLNDHDKMIQLNTITTEALFLAGSVRQIRISRWFHYPIQSHRLSHDKAGSS